MKIDAATRTAISKALAELAFNFARAERALEKAKQDGDPKQIEICERQRAYQAGIHQGALNMEFLLLNFKPRR